jgi:hypothetical protein
VEQQFYPRETFQTVTERRLVELKQIYSAYALSSIVLTFEDLQLDSVIDKSGEGWIEFFPSLVLSPGFLIIDAQ